MSDKSEKVAVGLSEDEKKRFRVAAAERGLSMSELAREVILEEVLQEDEEGNPNLPTAAAD